MDTEPKKAFETQKSFRFEDLEWNIHLVEEDMIVYMHAAVTLHAESTTLYNFCI